ncbi:hypothetical protein AYO39_01585 [Actinobacteria bacterium SCGC AG-212-D09]|nr:hypothetical protein AYO39_01585 [Actinobacteria bacterium SCGC AG-212-D09]
MGHIPVAVFCEDAPCSADVTGFERGSSVLLGSTYTTDTASDQLVSLASGKDTPAITSDLQFGPADLSGLRSAIDPRCDLDVWVGATVHSYATGETTHVVAVKHLTATHPTTVAACG